MNARMFRLSVLLAAVTCCAANAEMPGDSKLIREHISRAKFSTKANYQVMLRDLYHALSTKYNGMGIVEFDAHAVACGWTKLRDTPQHSGFVEYLVAKRIYTPSPGFSHDLWLQAFFSKDKTIMEVLPVMHISLKATYSMLLKAGYSPRSVLGRFITLKDFKKRAEAAEYVDAIDLTYYLFQYTQSPPYGHIFRIDVKLFDKATQGLERVSYGVVSGLDYHPGAARTPKAYKRTNTLVKPSDLSGWEALPEKSGELVFFDFK